MADDSLTSSQRKHLRGLAHSLRPVVVVGKNGVSQSLCAEADRALDNHELIKIRLQGCDRHERQELVDKLVEALQANLAGLIGNVAVLYRQNRDPEERKISPNPTR
jgi:RNA-binding protein